MFAAGFEMEIIKRWGRWISTTFHQYLWREEHVLANIAKGMLYNKKHVTLPCWTGSAAGKRPFTPAVARLVGISKAMSRVLRHRQLPGMDSSGWVSIDTVLNQRALYDLGAGRHDLEEIVRGGGGNAKLRFDLDLESGKVRCAQGHSIGSGVRPDCLPIESSVQYLIHGTSLEAAEIITRTGLSRCQRNHVHFYECDGYGNLLGGHSVRCSSDVGIVISARQCMDDGIVFYRSSNDVILTEGINGVVGVQYFRFILRLHRDPKRKRTVLWRQQGWTNGRMSESEDDIPQTMFTQTNMEDETMYTAISPESCGNHMRSPGSGTQSKSNGRVVAGGNPFSPDLSESECSKLQSVDDSQESDGDDFSPGRIADDESYCPPNPTKAPRVEHQVKKEEIEPTFATRATVERSRRNAQTEQARCTGVMYSPPLHPKKPKIHPADEVIKELADLAAEIDKHGETMREDEDWPPRRTQEESMARWWGSSSQPPVSIDEERYREHWREIMCPECYLVIGHDEKCDFQAKRGRWEMLKGGTTPPGGASASPSISFDGAGITPENSPMHASVR